MLRRPSAWFDMLPDDGCSSPAIRMRSMLEQEAWDNLAGRGSSCSSMLRMRAGP
jgi:hypothetical protein